MEVEIKLCKTAEDVREALGNIPFDKIHFQKYYIIKGYRITGVDILCGYSGLSHLYIGDDDTHPFEEILKDPRARDVRLSDIPYPSIVRTRFRVLEHNTTLVHLCIENSYVGSLGLKALSRYLGSNRTLRSLTLDQVSADSEGIEALSGALAVNDTLTVLFLPNNKQIGLEGAEALAEALMKNRSLLALSLNSCYLCGRGIIALLRVLCYNSTLKLLGVYSIKTFPSPEEEKEIRNLLVRSRGVNNVDVCTEYGTGELQDRAVVNRRIVTMMAGALSARTSPSNPFRGFLLLDGDNAIMGRVKGYL